MTQQQMQEIDAALQRGETPEEIARRYGLTRSGLSFKLLEAGKRIVMYRRLENTGTAAGHALADEAGQERRELAAA